MNQAPKNSTPKVNRTLYVLTVSMLFVIAVIIAVTSASNRSKNQNPSLSDSLSDSLPEQTLTPPNSDSPKDSESEKPQEKPSVQSNTPQTQTPPKDTSIPSKVSEPVPTFRLPVTGILSKKHDTELQVYSATMNDYRVHCGIDIVTAENAPVYAVADGKVEEIWNDPLMGYCISISHSGDSVSVYKNLAEELAESIEIEASVKEGQLIGVVGGSAMIEVAEEPHLHFELTVSGEAVNPLDYFNETALVSLSVDSSYES